MLHNRRHLGVYVRFVADNQKQTNELVLEPCLLPIVLRLKLTSFFPREELRSLVLVALRPSGDPSIASRALQEMFLRHPSGHSPEASDINLQKGRDARHFELFLGRCFEASVLCDSPEDPTCVPLTCFGLCIGAQQQQDNLQAPVVHRVEELVVPTQ